MISSTQAHITNLQWQRAIRLWRDKRPGEARKVLLELLADTSRFSYDEELTFRKDLAMVECELGNLDTALQIMLQAAILAEHTTNLALRGRFQTELGLIYQLQGNFEQAFQEHTAAAVYHEQAENWKSCGNVKNNLGALLIEADKPVEAHEYLDEAERIFTQLGEFTSIAQVWDTRARARLKEGDVDGALEVSLKSVDYLRTAAEPRLLAESLATLSLVCQAKRIADALIIADGCITDAAHALGIHHNTSLDHILKTKFPQLQHLRKPKTHSRRKK